jgi:hypothetical protein
MMSGAGALGGDRNTAWLSYSEGGQLASVER